MEKLLEDAGIKLSSVASDITGVSGRAMIAALVAGERDPAVLADLARRRLRLKIPELTEALTGRLGEHHAFLVRAHLNLIDSHTKVIEELTARIEVVIEPFRGARELACGVVATDGWCRRCGAMGEVHDYVTRRLAHEPFGWRPTVLVITLRRYACTGFGHLSVPRSRRRWRCHGTQPTQRCSPRDDVCSSRIRPASTQADGLLHQQGGGEVGQVDIPQGGKYVQPQLPFVELAGPLAEGGPVGEPAGRVVPQAHLAGPGVDPGPLAAFGLLLSFEGVGFFPGSERPLVGPAIDVAQA